MAGIILDAHSDVLSDVLEFRRAGESRVLERRHLPALRAAGVNVLVCSLFIRDELLPDGALGGAMAQISALRGELDESGDNFALCITASEAREAAAQGKIALFLSFEGAEPLGSDIFLLRAFYELGVRFLGLTWSRPNSAAEGCAFVWEDAPERGRGLTDFGAELVKEASELGMLIDVSHLNDRGFCDVAELVKGPFIASHSNCRRLCDIPRNLTDRQIETIARSGGVIGMNAYAPFSAKDGAAGTAQSLLEHAEHVAEIAGAEHVGLGLDLCDNIVSLGLESDGDRRDIFADHGEAAEEFFPLVYGRFGRGGADKILGENFMRVIEDVIG